MKKNKQEQVVPQGNIFVTPLEEVLPQSMLPYAEFVIMDRALPRVEDGLKPVQRRILYTMSEMGLSPDKPHKKSARIVGDCMGKYHPHGDSSVYDAMVRMAQDFNMGRTLVNGHGNFGSVDGDPAAAMRYTEARLEPLALELLRDLDKETVSFSLNFDDSLKEPDMLPGRFPNLLVNGASGIAVGLATNIPPHNLAEAIDGVVAYINQPTIKLPEMLKYIPAPDFPTGGYIIAKELHEAYKTGKGKISLRARLRVEEGDGDRKYIIISELPYQVNKSTLLKKIVELREEKKEQLSAIYKVSDESDRNGMRAVIELRGQCDPQKILSVLYKYTDLEVSFGINMVAIAGGKPMLMGLLDIIKYYVNYQREVVLRRTRFELNQAKERCHILEGLIVAVRNIDEVVAIIKKADSVADAREKLRARFSLSERQAQAILDLRLARLTKLEVFKLEEELKQLKELIERLSAIVASNRLQLNVVKEELLEIKKKYKTPRRSTLVFNDEEAGAERADVRAPGVPSILCITADKKLKCVSEKAFATANKEINERSKPGAIITQQLHLVSDETALVFTDKGNCYKLNPQDCNRRFADNGYALAEVCKQAEPREVPVAITKAEPGEGSLLFVTAQGMFKRTEWKEYNVSKLAFQAIRLNDNDRVVSVQPYVEDDNITVFFVTKNGMCLNAQKTDIPLQGRVSGGVKGMNLNAGDEVVFASQTDGDGEIVVAVSNGKYKRVITSTVDVLPRYRKGVKIVTLKEGEEVIFADCVTVPYYLAVLNDSDEWCELVTEDIAIDITASKGRTLKGVKWLPKAVYAMKYRELDEGYEDDEDEE